MRQYTNLVPTNTLVHEEVLNVDGERLGKIADFIVDLCDGKITYLVLAVDGYNRAGDKRFLAQEDKLIAVPWQAFDVDSGGFVLNVTRETLKNAPDFDEAQWPNTVEQHWADHIHFHNTNTSNEHYQ